MVFNVSHDSCLQRTFHSIYLQFQGIIRIKLLQITVTFRMRITLLKVRRDGRSNVMKRKRHSPVYSCSINI